MRTNSEAVVIVGGGQSGLAAARVAAGLRPVVLEVGERPAGSWPRYYYDSLKLFSPVRFNSSR